MQQAHANAIAIFLGFALVALAIVFGGNPFTSDVQSVSVSRGDKTALIYGSRNAPVRIVEFSDFECPFCARLHPTLQQLVDESDGQLVWEYRHFPLPIHRTAELAAQVGECVAREQGVEAFWLYADRVFANVSSLSSDLLYSIARELGVADGRLQTCVASDAIASQIAEDVATARHWGGGGTPFSIIIYEDATIRPVSGALPYAEWKRLLDFTPSE